MGIEQSYDMVMVTCCGPQQGPGGLQMRLHGAVLDVRHRTEYSHRRSRRSAVCIKTHTQYQPS